MQLQRQAANVSRIPASVSAVRRRLEPLSATAASPPSDAPRLALVREPRKQSQTSPDSSSARSRGSKVRCQAVFLDGGGVIVLPNGELVRQALRRLEIEIDPSLVARAHYRSVRQIDRALVDGAPIAYLGAVCRALGVPTSRLEDAVEALLSLADRGRSGEILWSQPAPHAITTMEALRSVGLPVFVVTNSDGHAA